MPVITVNTGGLAGHKFESLLDLLDAQERLKRRCKHPLKCRIVGHGKRGLHDRLRVWTYVICSRCNTFLENHETPLLKTKLPRWKPE